MAINIYLKADPLKGESTDDVHTDWIEVFNFSHGLSQPISGAGGAGGNAAARADFQPFVITKSIDKASVDLNIYCAKGTHIDKVELEVCQITGEKTCYLKYELENVMIQSLSIDGSGSERPHETVLFVYDKIAWIYTPINNDGSAGVVVGPKKWNIRRNNEE